MGKQIYDIRCPIHGLIPMNGWERELIDHPVFQRLRRVRQLAWTDYVYPGGMHTRFEHSIGVMHVATLLYDSILENSMDVLSRLYGDHGEHAVWKKRERQKVRLAALLHDVGHSPFSHASEDLFPLKGSEKANGSGHLFDDAQKKKKRFKHEDYSVALINTELRSAIEENAFNKNNFNISAGEVTDLLHGSPEAGPTLFWREILSNQLDADRMDYLLRDSHHLGVNYGKYDLHRLVSSVCAFESSRPDDQEARLGIGVLKGGVHAAESLIVARYSMFKQVYFHKTRMAYDIHLQHAMAELLPGGNYPAPSVDGLKEYLRWDDWRVQGLLADGRGGDHAKRMLSRQHLRMVYSSKDRLIRPKEKKAGLNVVLQEQRKLEAIKAALGDLLSETKSSRNSWYKAEEGTDISVVGDHDRADIRPLTYYSAMAELNSEDQHYLYVKPEDVVRAKQIIRTASHEYDQQASEKQNRSRDKKAINKAKRARPRQAGKKFPQSTETLNRKEIADVG